MRSPTVMRTLLAASAALSLAATVSMKAQAAAPAQIRLLDVDSASPGSFVGIYGSGFGVGQGTVQFTGASATEIALWSDTLIVVRVPQAAQPGLLHVQTAEHAQLASVQELQIHPGTIYVVSTAGNDSGPGTEQQPFQSLHRALEAVQPGDTVLVRAGTYDEVAPSTDPLPALYFPPEKGGQEGLPITWRGFGSEMPVLRATLPQTSSQAVLYVGAEHIRLARLDINGENNQSHGVVVQTPDVWLSGLNIYAFGQSGVTVGPVLDVWLLANHVHHGGTHAGQDHGLWVTGPSSVIVGNELDHLPSGYGLLLQYQSQSGAQVEANFIHDTAAGGIGLWRVAGNSTVVNNVLWNTGTSQGCLCALHLAYGAGAGEASSGDRVGFNTVVGTGQAAVVLEDRAGSVQLSSNLFADVRAGLQVLDQASQGALQSTRNLWASPTSEPPLFQWSGPWVELGEFQSQSQQETDSKLQAPGLVDPSQGDMHLTASSPAIDQGSADSAPAQDFDGLARPQGKAPDIGAFEYPAAEPPPEDAGAEADAHADGQSGADGQSETDAEEPDAASDDAGSPPSEAGSDDDGCGCRLAPESSSKGRWSVVALLALGCGLLRKRARC